MSADVTARLFHVNCSSHACTKQADGTDGLCHTCRKARADMALRLQVKEADFQKDVIELAQTLGWLACHFRPAKTAHGWRTPFQGDGAGFPDTILCRDRVIFAELKSSKGRATDNQLEWLAALQTAGVEAYLWRPDDLDEIMQVLSERRKAAA